MTTHIDKPRLIESTGPFTLFGVPTFSDLLQIGDSAGTVLTYCDREEKPENIATEPEKAECEECLEAYRELVASLPGGS